MIWQRRGIRETLKQCRLPRPEKSEGTEEERAKAFIAHIRQMNEHMGIPEHLSQIQEEDIEKMAKWAEQEANPLYPVPVVYDKKHFEGVIRKVAGK